MTATVTSDRVRGRGTALLRLLVRAGAVALGIGALWRSLFWVLAADRGLDLTDEGLYLLAARPPSIDAAWGTPAGWHTAPLFRMVGFDVAAFRTLGALLLVSAAGFLGREAVRLGQGVRKGANGTAERVERVLGAFLGGLGGLLYYGGLVRTPSYNWVTVLGATLAAVGLLQVVSARLPLSGAERTVPFLPWVGVGSLHLRGVLLAGFGAFFTIPAKPTTPVFFALLAIPILRLAGDLRFAVRTVLSVAATAAGFMTAAVLSGLWSPRFVAVFMRAIEAPGLLPGQGLTGAFLTIPRFPFDLVRDARVLTAVAMVLTVAVLTFGGTPASRARVMLARPRGRAAVLGVGLVVLGGLRWGLPWLMQTVHALPADGWTGFVVAERITSAFGSGLLGLLLGVTVFAFERFQRLATFAAFVALLAAPSQAVALVLDGPVVTQFVRPDVLRDALLVLLGTLTVAMLHRTSGREDTPVGSTVKWSHGTAVLSLWLIGVATGFGSGHGLVRQAALAAGILVAALLLFASLQPDRRLRVASMALIAAFVLPVTALHIVGNRQVPYRIQPVSAQSVPVGTDGALLRLDPDLAAFLGGLADDARNAGWEPGMPILATASRWSSTLPWHLGGVVPEPLMLTLGGYGEGSERRFEFNLDYAVDDSFESAWLLVTSDRHPRHEESLRWATSAADAAGQTFPDGYELVFRTAGVESRWVGEYGDIELWRPAVHR